MNAPSSLLRPLRTLPIARTLSLDVGVIHFIGIGGIGMSGIAEILHNLGYKVQGSDMSESANVDRLRKLGIHIYIGHEAAHVDDASVVVMSSAVKANNPELMEARARRIPTVRRSEMLAELMRLKMSVAVAGTHGKTTTTSMLAHLFEGAGFAPTVINGGIINAYGTNARLGTGEWMVVEADESDGTFIKIPSTVAVITNIDPEHMEFYGSFDKLRAAFETFIQNLPFYGFAVLCIDHPEVQQLAARISDRRIITYGFNPQADICGSNPTTTATGQRCDIACHNRNTGEVELIQGFELPMHGKHNLQNALAAVAVLRELGAENSVLSASMAQFSGVKRRFTHTGTAHGIKIIDDYGHHPVEIAATLGSARQAQQAGGGRVIAVVQPHRYTRLRDLFDQFCTCFNDADHVVVTPIYSAGEDAIEGYSQQALVDGLRAHGHKSVHMIAGEDALAPIVAQLAQAGDMVVCLGAGSISLWANQLPATLEGVSLEGVSA